MKFIYSAASICKSGSELEKHSSINTEGTAILMITAAQSLSES